MVKIPKVINDEFKLDSKNWRHLTKTKLLDLKQRIRKAETVTLVDRFFNNRNCTWIDFESENAGFVWTFEKSQQFGTSTILKEIAIANLPRNPSGFYFYEGSNCIHLFSRKKLFGEWVVNSIYFEELMV